MKTKLVPSIPFHGSYSPEDVTFLLRQVRLESTELEEKERLIQSGQRHYSQMLTLESAPSAQYEALYQQALEAGTPRLATEVQALALALRERRTSQPIVLISLVRAGVPLGVLLSNALRDLGVQTAHYGISIIRDKGIDQAALAWIRERHPVNHWVFVDGWVGKGAIHTELQRSLRSDYPQHAIPLVVLADPTGRAWLAASGEDWLIPFGILGCTVSGLVSRSIMPEDNGWHGCVYYQHLAAHDRTHLLIQTINAKRRELNTMNHSPSLNWSEAYREQLKRQSAATLDDLIKTFQISNLNRLKPSIAEAARAVLRRVPERILVQDLADPHLKVLCHLAKQHNIELQALGTRLAPYRAVTIIKKAI